MGGAGVAWGAGLVIGLSLVSPVLAAPAQGHPEQDRHRLTRPSGFDRAPVFHGGHPGGPVLARHGHPREPRRVHAPRFHASPALRRRAYVPLPAPPLPVGPGFAAGPLPPPPVVHGSGAVLLGAYDGVPAYPIHGIAYGAAPAYAATIYNRPPCLCY